MMAILALLSVYCVGLRHRTDWGQTLARLRLVISNTSDTVDILTVENNFVCKGLPVYRD